MWDSWLLELAILNLFLHWGTLHCISEAQPWWLCEFTALQMFNFDNVFQGPDYVYLGTSIRSPQSLSELQSVHSNHRKNIHSCTQKLSNMLPNTQFRHLTTQVLVRFEKFYLHQRDAQFAHSIFCETENGWWDKPKPMGLVAIVYRDRANINGLRYWHGANIRTQRTHIKPMTTKLKDLGYNLQQGEGF